MKLIALFAFFVSIVAAHRHGEMRMVRLYDHGKPRETKRRAGMVSVVALCAALIAVAVA